MARRHANPACRKPGTASGAAIAVVLALLSPACAAEPIVHDGESPPAKAWRAAMETADLAALAKMHDSSTVAFPPGQMQVKGATAIIAGYADLFRTYTVAVKIQDAHWVEVAPLVVSWGLTTLTLHPRAGGADVVSQTRFTDAAVRREDGGWLYLIDHASKPADR